MIHSLSEKKRHELLEICEIQLEEHVQMVCERRALYALYQRVRTNSDTLTAVDPELAALLDTVGKTIR